MEYNISQCQVPEDHHKEVFDAMKSFPSGHAQIACFTSAFIIVSVNRCHRVSPELYLSPGVSPAPTPDQQCPTPLLAPAGSGHHGRGLLSQSHHGQSSPRHRCLGGSNHRSGGGCHRDTISRPGVSQGDWRPRLQAIANRTPWSCPQVRQDTTNQKTKIFIFVGAQIMRNNLKRRHQMVTTVDSS